MDKEVGDILKQLQEDNLHEDTIVFFYSDHGSGMPRHKRALLDPHKWQHLVPAEAGSSSSQLIHASAPKPDHMEGPQKWMNTTFSFHRAEVDRPY